MPTLQGDLNGKNLRLAILASHFAEKKEQSRIIELLLEGTLEALLENEVEEERIDVLWVPGAFELPALAAEVARTQKYDALIALGCLVRGETLHFEIIAHASASGLAETAREFRVPVINGILTVENIAQALARADSKKLNKGKQFAEAAIEMSRLFQKMKEQEREVRKKIYGN